MPGELTFSSWDSWQLWHRLHLLPAKAVTVTWPSWAESECTVHGQRGTGSLSALQIPPRHTEPSIFACEPHQQSYLYTCGGCKELIYYLFSFNDLCHSPLGIPICTMQILLSPWQYCECHEQQYLVHQLFESSSAPELSHPLHSPRHLHLLTVLFPSLTVFPRNQLAPGFSAPHL